MDENEFGMAIYADDIDGAYLVPSRIDELINIDYQIRPILLLFWSLRIHYFD
ncbi:hypothetical protein XNA1_2230016 [Xenorhabdus nematophila str. Anatoliense]|nr:hypothetical protein XNA1_2230016 [Xenorhabdus nematophila str. Anatoliense]